MGKAANLHLEDELLIVKLLETLGTRCHISFGEIPLLIGHWQRIAGVRYHAYLWLVKENLGKSRIRSVKVQEFP
jgi:hypothetical protein